MSAGRVTTPHDGSHHCDETDGHYYSRGGMWPCDVLKAARTAAARARLDAEGTAEGWACVEADKHRPVPREAYCSCGFCVWSAEHVVVMVLRSMFEHRLIVPASGAASQAEPLAASRSHASALTTSAPSEQGQP